MIISTEAKRLYFPSWRQCP